MRRVVVLGSTGSIGRTTIDVIKQYPAEFRVMGLSAHRNFKALARQASELKPLFAVLSDDSIPVNSNGFPRPTRLQLGARSLIDLAGTEQADTIVNGIVGAAGLLPTLAAVRAGKRVALANKETMVMAGGLMREEAQHTGAEIIPVDSEHSAILQCLMSGRKSEVARIILTASGGPFHRQPDFDPESVTPEQALAHPNWDMGPKITVDSATMMNKGLEVIEARWFFDVTPDRISVVIHPQSIVHSMVEFTDGSVVAQMGLPDMKIPISYALFYPNRMPDPAPRLDLPSVGHLDFEEPDFDRFPCLRLAYQALEMGGTAPAVLNAADEIAVKAFLEHKISFADIPRVVQDALSDHVPDLDPDLDDIVDTDRRTRETLATKLGLDP